MESGAFDQLAVRFVYVHEHCQVTREELGGDCAIVPLYPEKIGEVPLEALRRARMVVLPEGFESIGDFLFIQTDVEEVHVPASVVSIGDEAFRGC